MAQISDAPSKAILRNQIIERIAENDNSDHHVDQEGEASLPKNRFFDRELNWFKFNRRVLEHTENEDVPLLERANFAAIFVSNLDEFFMIRVAGLKRHIDSGIAVPSVTGLNPCQQLRTISETVHRLQDKHTHYTIDTILLGLEKGRVVPLAWDKLTSFERGRLSCYYRQQMFPALASLAVGPARPSPYISDGSVSLAVIVENPASGKLHFVHVKIPDNLPRLMPVDDMTDEESENRRCGFIAMGKLIAAHLESLSPGVIIKEACSFHVIHNEGIDVEEDDAKNLLNVTKRELLRRRFGPPIHLEITDTASLLLPRLFADQLGMNQGEVYCLSSPLDLTVLSKLGSVDRSDLKSRPFAPTTNRRIAEVESSCVQDILAAIRERDILLHRLYGSFPTSIQTFFTRAAADPKVLTIKQTLYRTSSNSPIIDAPINTARADKRTLALVETRTRFDEDANIAQIRRLKRAGMYMIYDTVGLKTRYKFIEVVRQEADGLRRYCHVGTGSYNPKTARLHTGLGLLAYDPVVGRNLTRPFSQLFDYVPKFSFHRLPVAPHAACAGLVQCIRREEDAARTGKEIWIKIKVDSTVDEKTVDALYRASQADVRTDTVKHGICVLKSGVPGLSENTRVRPILGHFPEHSRIYAFYNAGDPQIDEGPASGPEVYIGLADLIYRNLGRHVKALMRVTALEQIDEFIKYVDLQMTDFTMGWHIQPDGTYVPYTKDDEGRPLVDSQEYLIRRHRRRPGSHN